MGNNLNSGYILAQIVLAATLLSGCSSSPNIYSNVDPEADFSRFSSYGFVENPATNNQDYESLETSFLKVAVAQHMDRRGYSYSSDPDIRINFYLHTEEKLRTYSTPVAHGYYGYRDYNSWGGYTAETQVQQYTQGTLNIDLVDARGGKMIWEGVATGTLTDRDVQNMEQTLDAAVAQIFEQFPATAAP